MRKTFAKIIAIIAITVIMLAGSSALAYTGDGYTIDIPSTYTSGGSNMWTNTASRATVNIQILANSTGQKVSQSTLQETINSLKSSYSGITIEKSEITKLNGMDAIHLVSNVSGMYIEQYAITTSSKIYVLTIGAYEKSYLSSSEATSIISSFNVTGASSSSSSYSNNNNTVNNTTNTSSYNNTISNSLGNKSTNKYVDDVDDEEEEEEEEDDEDEKSSKKSKSSKSDDDEDKTWVIVAIVAGVIVFALIAIIIIVAIVISGKKKQQY